MKKRVVKGMLGCSVAVIIASMAVGCGSTTGSTVYATSTTSSQMAEASDSTSAQVETSTSNVAEASTPTPTPIPNMTASQAQALVAAQAYIAGQPFSYQGLINQLSSEYGNQFSVDDATFAADHCGADWNAEALEAAKSYIAGQSFSYQGLIDQLTSSYGDQYTADQAKYAADNCGADWNAEAVEAAQNYVNNMGGFSRDSLIDQLTSPYGDKFTTDQATYAADQLGL